MNQDKDKYKSILKLPIHLWILADRPYFESGMKHLKANLPWGSRNTMKETETKHNIFEEAGFELGPVLGHGSFSTVVMAYWTQFKQNVAVKIYIKHKDHDTKSILKLLPNEINMLKTLRHPNIVSYFGALETKLRVYLIMELVGGGNLLEYLRRHDRVSEPQAKKWFAQIVSGIKYAHDLEIAHRDIKLENILLDMRQNVRITDFGFATPGLSWSEEIPNSGWEKVDDCRGSSGYMAPELIMGEPYNPLLADVWAMGIVLYCLTYGKFPLGEFTSENLINMVEDLQLPEEPSISPECQNVFSLIFQMEDVRIRSIDLLECDWLKEEEDDIEIGRKAKLKWIQVKAEKERIRRLEEARLKREKQLEKLQKKLENKYNTNDSSDSTSSSGTSPSGFSYSTAITSKTSQRTNLTYITSTNVNDDNQDKDKEVKKAPKRTNKQLNLKNITKSDPPDTVPPGPTKKVQEEAGEDIRG